MKNLTFSEKNDIKNIISSGEVNQDNVNSVISSFAKYNLNVKDMSDKENFEAISQWLKKHYKWYVETEFFNIINDKINAAHKYHLLESDDLIIYREELDKIVSVNNIKQEKILFTILCIAKLQKNILGYKNGKYVYALTNIFKLARVHIPSTERENFMHNLFKMGFIAAPFKNNDSARWVTFLSDEGEKVITVNELDFQELAFVYEQWKNGNRGFTRCQKCNRLMKQSKTKPKKYCEECGKEVERENSKERVRRYREKCNENLTQ